MTQASLSEFADKINEVFPMVIREFLKRQTNELSKGNITMPQMVILNFLYNHGESRMTDLAHFMSVTTAAMTGIIERLVRYGYVLRISEPNDRRIIKIKLTSKGAVIVKKINQQKRRMIIDIFSKLPQQERDDYLRIILHIRDILVQPA